MDTPPSISAFDVALSSQIKKLQLTADTPLFDASTPAELLNIIAAETDNYLAKDSIHRALDWSASIIEPLLKFLSAIDAGISSHPELGGIVWGCIRFILTVACSHSKYFDMIVTTLTDISLRLHFYQDYALVLYRNSSSVQQALARVYGAILDFCHEVHYVFHKPRSRKRRGSLTTLAISIQPWRESKMRQIVDELDRVQSYLKEEVEHVDRMTDLHTRNHVDRHLMNVEHSTVRIEAGLSTATQVIQGQAMVAAASREKQEYSENERQFRNLITSIPHTECGGIQEEVYARIENDPYFGHWLLRHPEYDRWATGSGKCVLRVVGKPGAGKTVLTSLIIKDLVRLQQSLPVYDIAVSFFYCRYDDSTRQKPLDILGSICRQLLLQLPTYLQHQTETRLSHTVPELIDTIRSTVQHFGQVYVVIDALDECPADALDLLLPALKRLELSLLLVSRPISRFSLYFATTRIIEITDTNVASDIWRYVHRRVHNPEEHEAALHISNPSLFDEVVDALVNKADGMFLWVNLQILHLCEQRTDHDIIVALDSLPRGLVATFHRALKHAYELLEPRRARVRRVFTWLISYGGPVPLDLLQQAIAVEEMDAVWDASKLVTDPKSLVDDCANLIRLSHDGVQFVHASVRDFLLEDNGLDTPAMRYFSCSSIQQQHCDVFFTCCKASRLLDCLGDRLPYTSLISYIQNDSLAHIRHIDEICDPGDVLSTFKSMLCLKSLSPFHSHFDDFISFGPTADCAMLTHLCAYLSCTRILSHLLRSGDGSVWHLDSGGRAPLHYATGLLFPPIQFFEVSPECARLLLQEGADADSRDDNELTPLHYIATKPTIAAPERDTEVMLARMLLEHGADLNAQNLQGVRPVHLVTINDYINRRLLAFLVEHGANINARDLHGDAPLHLLFQKRWVSDEDTKFLLACGADPNLANHAGLTPLQVLLTRPR
ncbi:ankyrin [Hymenopellis radicata]|nr:ankyrin [Hymenopellis radicata]